MVASFITQRNEHLLPRLLHLLLQFKEFIEEQMKVLEEAINCKTQCQNKIRATKAL